MTYEHPKISQEQLETERIIKLKQLEEADAYARKFIKQSEISADKRSEALRGQEMYEMRMPDQIGE